LGAEPSAARVLGANFAAGYVAGTIAAAATCPLDVAKTRRQIQVGLPPHHMAGFYSVYIHLYIYFLLFLGSIKAC
jgi:hypothetical protein